MYRLYLSMYLQIGTNHWALLRTITIAKQWIISSKPARVTYPNFLFRIYLDCILLAEFSRREHRVDISLQQSQINSIPNNLCSNDERKMINQTLTLRNFVNNSSIRIINAIIVTLQKLYQPFYHSPSLLLFSYTKEDNLEIVHWYNSIQITNTIHRRYTSPFSHIS